MATSIVDLLLLAVNYKAMPGILSDSRITVPTTMTESTSHSCRNDSMTYLQAVLQSKPWALQMYDASGRLPSGLLSGNIHSTGHFDQCLLADGPGFIGKYCTAFLGSGPNASSEDSALLFNTTNYMLPSIAWCIPSSCTATDFGSMLSKILSAASAQNANFSLAVAANEDYCFTRNDKWKPLDGAEIPMLVVLSLLALLVIVGTSTTIWMSVKKTATRNPLMKFLACFSATDNARKLLSVKKSSSTLSCIHGIRFLSIAWIVAGHSSIQATLQFNQNLAGVFKDIQSWVLQGLVNATIAVDSFFLLSGLLLAYLLLHQLKENGGKFNIFLLYVHRYIRLTPVYAIVFGFISTWIVRLGSGPTWFNIEYSAKACRQVWWQQFLYVNNLLPRSTEERLCMTESWYLANDMQLFLISPALVYPIWKWRRLGLIPLTLVTLGSLSANIAATTLMELPPTSMPSRPLTMAQSAKDFWINYYPLPWYRAPPYLVGIYLGWILHMSAKSSYRLPKIAVYSCWIVSGAIFCSTVYGLSPYLNESTVPSIPTAISVMYGSFHRCAWAVALAWLIFACTRGYGGFVNRFLSWKPFIPLSRLTYCTYLIHLNLIYVYHARSRVAFYYNITDEIYLYCGHLLLSMGLAFILSVTVEASFVNLDKLIFSRYKVQEKKSQGKISMGIINQGFSVRSNENKTVHEI